MYSITSLIPSSITLFILSVSLHYHIHIHKQGPFPYASTLIKLNNYIYSFVSLLFFIALVCSSELLTRLCDLDVLHALHRFGTYVRAHDEQMRHIYHLSKTYEPHIIHPRPPQPHRLELLAGLNTLHHAFMYAYFGGVASFRPILPFTGFLQLMVGLVGEAVIVHTKNNSKLVGEEVVLWPHIVSTALLGMYFVLFAFEPMELARKQKTGRGKVTVGVTGDLDENEGGICVEDGIEDLKP
ncbi:conserved hypothetical protein [Histoplasma capsulatum var. duboisii H88]|uniref:Uncharacterized protein n=1 Tax=Ajellomyces capsulatus (strain H88) TaxID=544711 RepID=F0UU24_AJEC8|nr:conserved hypothetical protein [Histoplasma capsulatum var. duboisii H88]